MLNFYIYYFNLSDRPFVKKIQNSIIVNESFQPENLLDIYFIVLDGYAGRNTLKNSMSFDNYEIVDYLTDKGFFVPKSSKSNYSRTYLSLASTLNMDYVNDFGKVVSHDKILVENIIPSGDRKDYYQLIQNGKVPAYLKSIGYQFINFSSGWGPTEFMQSADVNYSFNKSINEPLMMIIETSIVGPFLKYLIKYFKFEFSWRDHILDTFSALGKLNNISKPKFVFAHILCPHSPYIFGKNGEVVDIENFRMVDGGIPESKKNDLYLNQLIYVNKKIKTFVDEIITSSSSPPIIIIASDHGKNLSSTFRNQRLINASFPYEGDWLLSPPQELFFERTNNFIATFLPNGGNQAMYHSVSNVNIFRILFNYYFNTNYLLLDDLSFYSYPETLNFFKEHRQ